MVIEKLIFLGSSPVNPRCKLRAKLPKLILPSFDNFKLPPSQFFILVPHRLALDSRCSLIKGVNWAKGADESLARHKFFKIHSRRTSWIFAKSEWKSADDEGTQMCGGCNPHRLGGIDERLPVRLFDNVDERNHAMAAMPLIYCANSTHWCKFSAFTSSPNRNWIWMIVWADNSPQNCATIAQHIGLSSHSSHPPDPGLWVFRMNLSFCGRPQDAERTKRRSVGRSCCTEYEKYLSRAYHFSGSMFWRGQGPLWMEIRAGPDGYRASVGQRRGNCSAAHLNTQHLESEESMAQHKGTITAAARWIKICFKHFFCCFLPRSIILASWKAF